MDLIILVMGDPWTPELPPEAAVRPGLARLIVVMVLIGFLLFGGKEIPVAR